MLRGLTGMVQFDNEGFRTNIMLDIMELSYNGLQRVGTWNSSGKLNITRMLLPTSVHDSESLHNRTFRVLTALVSLVLCKLSKTAEILIRVGLCSLQDLNQLSYPFKWRLSVCQWLKQQILFRWDHERNFRGWWGMRVPEASSLLAYVSQLEVHVTFMWTKWLDV